MSEDTRKQTNAAEALLKAALVTVIHLERLRDNGTYQGDPEHGAWAALLAAITQAQDAGIGLARGNQ